MGSGLRVEGLTVAYHGVPAVCDVTLEVPAGAITALLGPNGAGKSSLVSAIGGLLRPAAGRLLVEGATVRFGRPGAVRRAGVAVAPEGHRVLASLSVEDNLRVAGSTLPRGGRGPAVEAVLELFPELRALLDRPARMLSGGEQQMLALGQAMLTQPRFIVVDELSLGLAPVVIRRLADALVEVSAAGTGVLLIEQFTSLALEISTRSYVLHRGRVTFSGTPGELAAQPDVLHSAYLAEALSDA
jgi:branched-chain amino acid transport system ATP-binding protein